jgi:hypothetical protein
LLGGVDQFTVFEFFPTVRPRFLHAVAGEKAGGSWGVPLSKRISIPASAYPYVGALSRERATNAMRP